MQAASTLLGCMVLVLFYAPDKHLFLGGLLFFNIVFYNNF